MDLKQDPSIHSNPSQNLKRRQPKLLLALGILAAFAIWNYPRFRNQSHLSENNHAKVNVADPDFDWNAVKDTSFFDQLAVLIY